MHRPHHYARIWALLILIFVLTFTQRIAAQEPLVDLRLLAWSADGSFLLGATPGQVMTLPDGSLQQQKILWRLAANGSDKQQLAVGFNPQLSPDGRLVTFSQLDAQNQLSLWGIDVETGAVQPLGVSFLSTPDGAMAGDPPGRVYLSPDGKKRAILVNEFFTAALWLGEENAPAQLILRSDGELFSDLAWRADGQALAFIRTPLGSQTDTSSELWRIDLSGKNTPTRLSQNNVVDRSPVWSADGTHLAIIRNGQMAVVPSHQLLVEEFSLPEPAVTLPELAPIGPAAQLIPPTHIKVIHHASNTCRSLPEGHIVTIPFEDYVKRVVPYEVFPSWPAETLKAQAVAARTYGWDKYLQNPGGSYHVTDWINHQYMCDDTFPSTNQAVDDTRGEYLAYNGQVITAMFSAENSSPTKTNTNVNYLLAVDDSVSFGQTRNGHGYGMGQWGAQRWADQYQWSYQAILRHYYSNVTLEEAGVPAGTAPPNVSLAVPWSNHYVTSNKLWLLLNTSDDGGSITQTNAYLTTPSETNLLLSEAGPANQAGYVVDISGWADQALLNNTLVLTAEAFDVTGKRGVVSPTITIGVDRDAPTAFLTTATTLSGTTTITDSPVVSLTLTGFDITAGATHIALGRKEWEWEGESLTRQTIGGQPVGQVVCDSQALNGLAMQATVAGDSAGHWSSDEITLPTPKQYRAYFRVKVGDFATSTEVARLEVINNQSGALIGLHRLRGTDFRANDTYQEFHVDFDYQTVVPVILRLNFQDAAEISLDRIIVVEYPIPYASSPTYGYPNFRLKVIDGAGNVSNDLLVLPTSQSDRRIYLPVIIRSGVNLSCTSTP